MCTKQWMVLVAISPSLFAISCNAESVGSGDENEYVNLCEEYPSQCSEDHDGVDGEGGEGMPSLTLPFPSGEYWQLTHSYNPENKDDDSHQDYGGTYSDDRYALDFAQGNCQDYGDPVTPMAEGEIFDIDYDTGSDSGYGNSVLIKHENGYYSRYAHFSEILVSLGQKVNTSDYIGKVGNTGYVIGTSCSEHPGTHLHVAVYKDGMGQKPEPLSGETNLQDNCWYNREGDKNCSGNPGDYDDGGTDIDGEGQLDVAYLAVDPESGTATETEFVWVAIVVSPDAAPESTLYIHNPDDNYSYPFDMERQSDSSPYVFTYQKTLNSALTYSYWVKTSNGDGNDTSSTQYIRVDNESHEDLEVQDIDWDPHSGQAGETEFEWYVEVESDERPDIDLQIVNPNDANVYSFSMDVESDGNSRWIGTYQKTLRDPTDYVFWAVADIGETKATSSIETMSVE